MFDISVYLTTYYSEKYIRQALDSVFSQKTKHSFEVVVSDDGSKDKTIEILEEYKNKYPNNFRYEVNKENLGIPKNIYKSRCMCKGKYIVNLDGDDYWIDDNKLEKQISFLEDNPQYDMVCTRFEFRVNDNNYPYDVAPKKDESNKEFGIKDYEKGHKLNQHGFMLKNYFLDEEGRKYFGQAKELSDKVDDMCDEILLLLKCKIFVLDEITDVYRVIEDKNSKNFNSLFTYLEQTKYHVDAYNKLYELYRKDIDFKTRYRDKITDIIIMSLLTGKFKEFNRIYRTFPKEYKTVPMILSAFPKCFKIAYNKIRRNIK